MIGWQNDKRWADQFIPAIKRILGEHLIGEPPVAEDQERNTDLIVLRMDAVRIAVRVRKAEQLDRAPWYAGEFTIRTVRPSGVQTELGKIIAGWGDYLFYGFGQPTGMVHPWALCDLRVFRLWHSTQLFHSASGKSPGVEQRNRDASSSFRVFSYSDLPAEFVVASHGIARREAA